MLLVLSWYLLINTWLFGNRIGIHSVSDVGDLPQEVSVCHGSDSAKDTTAAAVHGVVQIASSVHIQTRLRGELLGGEMVWSLGMKG